MATRTLAQLREEIRDRSDKPGTETSGSIKNSVLNNWINASISELHDLLITTYGADYYLKSGSITLVAGTPFYNLPDDFYKLKAVDYTSGLGDVRPYGLLPYNFNERNNYSQYSNTIYENYKYRVVGSQVGLIPAESITTSDVITLWYHPVYTRLENDNDTFDGINGYEEYIVCDVCVKAALKEEEDPAAFYQQKTDMKARIMDSADNRSANNLNISDVYAENRFNADYY